MAATLLVAIAATGCRDELPTAAGTGLFPGGTLLTSLVVELPADEFLRDVRHFVDFTTARDVPYNLVANQFDGALTARTLFRPEGFPASVTYTGAGGSVTDTEFVYSTGEVLTNVDSLASRVTGSVTLSLRLVNQPWDANTATWSVASDAEGVQTPWLQPGGSPGSEIARTTWAPGDTVLRDTVRWQVDSLAVARMAADDFAGLIVIAEGGPSRVQIAGFTLRTGVRPASAPDTVIPQTIPGGPSTFIFTPAAPAPAGQWTVGGVASARTVLRVALPERVRGCPPGTPAGTPCPEIRLRDVVLNDVSLQLRPVAITDGFRPLVPIGVRLRTLAEPELGRWAPLGPPALGRQVAGFPPLFAEAQIATDLFVTPGDTVVNLILTDHFRATLAADTAVAQVSTAFALLAEPEGATFGQARFQATPRLRIVFTLPVQPTSP
jgi:hypothetical protein